MHVVTRLSTKPARSLGFALPTVLISSIILMIVLLLAVQASSSVRTALSSQYYDQMARLGAESGVAYAESCLKKADFVPAWSNNDKDLLPNTDCEGNPIGASAYTQNSSQYRTSFSVGKVTVDGPYLRFAVSAKVELLRTSDGQPWRVYNTTSRIVMDTGVVTASRVASGRFVVCGIMSGSSYCWGENVSGQLGNGTNTNSNIPVKVARKSGVLYGRQDQEIAGGDQYVCVISDNEVFCWGRNNYGQLGIGVTGNRNEPVQVTQSTGLAGKTISQVVTSGEHTCAIASGDIYCWGRNQYGQLGDNTTTTRLTPVRVQGIGAYVGKPVTKVATTPLTKSTCAIADKVYCWGRNQYGQLGDGTTTDRYVPTSISYAGVLSGKTVTDLAVGGNGDLHAEYPTYGYQERNGHACVVAGGEAYCWGNNNKGQLGIGNNTNSSVPVKVSTSGLLSGKTVQSVAVGYGHSCVSANDTLYCWGINSEGQLGRGSTGASSLPVAVAVKPGALQGKTVDPSTLTAAANRVCVIADVTSYCWGRNLEGQIGDGTYINRFEPTESIFLKLSKPPLIY